MTDFDSSPGNGEAVDGDHSSDVPRAGEQAPSGPASDYIDVFALRDDLLGAINDALVQMQAAGATFPVHWSVQASAYIRNLAEAHRLLDE